MMHINNHRLSSCCKSHIQTRIVISIAAIGLVSIGCKSDDNKNTEEEKDNSTESACPWDDLTSVDEAQDVDLGEEISGYLCPLDDADYYAFTLSSDQSMVQIDVVLEAIATAINPVYIIYDSDGSAKAQSDQTESASTIAPLSIIHQLDPGDYVLQVHDQGRDATDNYHPYLLTITGLSDNDDNEPNDDAENAKSLSGDTEGYLSYRGDEDWYSITASANEILKVSLSVSEGIAPAYTIVDESGNEVVSRTNEASELEFQEPLSAAGTYYLIVHQREEDELEFDPEQAYELTIEQVSDPDTNEPNDNAGEATVLSASVTCSSEWNTMTATGYIASSGDSDWYRIGLADSVNAVVDVEVDFNNAGSLPEDFQASVRIVRPAAGNACSEDQDCHELQQNTCSEDLDCSGIGNTCSSNGMCSGASACLPGGVCGANIISRTSAALETSDPEYDPGAPETPGNIKAGAPLFGVDSIYVVVEDYKGDSLSVDHAYSLTVRIAKDTDPNENTSVYLNAPMVRDEDDSLNLGPHQDLAVTVPVEDCVANPDSCCTGANWTSGAISYTFDQDWFRYDHPCPESDCSLMIYYEVAAGPTDVMMSIYLGSSVWYDTIIEPISDTGDQSAKSDIYGDDKCLYAYRDHSEYYFNVRDTIYVDEGDAENDGIWDWDRDQTYRFCIAKYQDTCNESLCNNDPTYGCGQLDEAEE